MLLIENELPARGDMDFTELWVKPDSERGDKNILGRKWDDKGSSIFCCSFR